MTPASVARRLRERHGLEEAFLQVFARAHALRHFGSIRCAGEGRRQFWMKVAFCLRRAYAANERKRRRTAQRRFAASLTTPLHSDFRRDPARA